MRKIEGSGYGCPLIGFLDGIFHFLSKVFTRIQKENKKIKEFLANMESSGLNTSILSFFLQLGQRSDISPRGIISFLSFIHDSIYCEFSQFAFKIYQAGMLQLFAQLICENQIESIKEWPSSYGGGSSCAHLISA